MGEYFGPIGGATGAPGAAGATGATGPTGPTGATGSLLITQSASPISGGSFTAPAQIIAGTTAIAFLAGAGSITFAGGGFSNGCLSLNVNVLSGNAYVLNLVNSTYTKTGGPLNLFTSNTGATVTATVTVSYMGIGW